MKRLIIITCLMAVVYGCGSTDPAAFDYPDLPATFQGTVGSYCDLTGYDSIRVQCFSLVVGLHNTGSSECPPSAREYIVKHIRSLRDSGMLPRKYDDLTAGEILSGRDTAVVEVTGLVPAGAPKGERFDVEVLVAEGTQTTSLQSGWLIPSELRVVVGRATGGQLVRSITARASGPIFINPLPISTMTQRRSDPRRGIVLGGGVSSADRVITLALLRPDFRNAQQIQKRLNNRFAEAGGRVVTEATREYINLQVPPSYRGDYNHFISLVWGLYMQESQDFVDNKLRELGKLAREPDQDFEMISLAWEAIGRPALGSLQILYREPDIDEAGFHAAQTAVRLGDNRALNIMIDLAAEDNHRFQLEAIKILSDHYTDARVQSSLRKLINHSNSQIKMLAYEGLRNTLNLTIETTAVSNEFKLEVVDSPGENVILIWATNDPRIVIFGKEIRCRRNVYFESNTGELTINAGVEDRRLTLTRKLPMSQDYMSQKSPFGVSELVTVLALPWQSILDEKPRAPGLNFSEIVGILYQLCDEEVIEAQFRIHRVVN